MSPMVTLNFIMINLTVIFLFFSSTDSCQQSFVLLLLFVIVPNLGLFIKSVLLKRKPTWVCDHLDEVAGYHWPPKWVENRYPGSSRATVMYLDFQSIDFVSSANYRMVCKLIYRQTIFSFWKSFLCTEWGEMRECWMNPWVHIEFIVNSNSISSVLRSSPL